MGEKADEELFFVQRSAGEDGTAASRPLGKRKRKPLRSEAHLTPNPAIVPIASQKRKRTTLVSERAAGDPVDSSSDDGGYDTSSTYSQLRKHQAEEILKCKPPKPTVTVVMRDLWSDAGGCTAVLVVCTCIAFYALLYILYSP